MADVVKTTLSPKRMDKLIHDDKGNVTISNDDATIMKLLDIVHLAAKIQLIILKLHMQDFSPALENRNEQPETVAPPIVPPLTFDA